MKRICFLIAFIGLLTTYTKAYSAPSCASFIQGKKIELSILDQIKNNIPEYMFTEGRDLSGDFLQFKMMMPRQKVNFRQMVNLRYWSEFNFERSLNVTMQFKGDSHANIFIHPRSFEDNDIKHAKDKATALYKNMLTAFKISTQADDFTAPAAIRKSSLKEQGPLVVYFSIKNLSPKKIDMLSYFIKNSVGLPAKPSKVWWNFLGTEPVGSIYHVPKRLTGHQPPILEKKDSKNSAGAYAIPTNLPPPILAYFSSSSGFKFILSGSEWMVEARYETPSGEIKTLMMTVTPDQRVTIMKHTPYQAETYIQRIENMYDDLLNGRFKSLTYRKESIGTQSDPFLKTKNFIKFFDELKRKGYKQIGPKVGADVVKPAKKIHWLDEVIDIPGVVSNNSEAPTKGSKVYKLEDYR